jgi:hypothetical protein
MCLGIGRRSKRRYALDIVAADSDELAHGKNPGYAVGNLPESIGTNSKS